MKKYKVFLAETDMGNYCYMAIEADSDDLKNEGPSYFFEPKFKDIKEVGAIEIDDPDDLCSEYFVVSCSSGC